jgi:hypothetical protein
MALAAVQTGLFRPNFAIERRRCHRMPLPDPPPVMPVVPAIFGGICPVICNLNSAMATILTIRATRHRHLKKQSSIPIY